MQPPKTVLLGPFPTALSFKNSSPCQKQHYFIARIQAVFSLVLHFSLLVLTD